MGTWRPAFPATAKGSHLCALHHCRWCWDGRLDHDIYLISQGVGKQKIRSTSPQKCFWMPGSYKIWSTLWVVYVSRGKITHRSPNMDYEMLKPFQGAPSTAPTGLCIIYHPPLELMKQIRWNQQLFCLVASKVNHLQQADDSHAKYQYLLVAFKVSFRGFPGSTSTSLRISG